MYGKKKDHVFFFIDFQNNEKKEQFITVNKFLDMEKRKECPYGEKCPDLVEMMNYDSRYTGYNIFFCRFSHGINEGCPIEKEKGEGRCCDKTCKYYHISRVLYFPL